MPGISVIMPVFNAEKYLKEALVSLQNQTYRDFELICINDASTDGTLEILQEFQKNDSRIKIFSNLEQKGAALSRNKGLLNVKGEYITFLDGDDVFEEEMLQLAYDAAKKYDVDIVMYEYQHFLTDDIGQKARVYRAPEFINKFCKDSFSIVQYSPMDYIAWGSSPCNKLFRKKFIESKHLTFQAISSSNDIFFVELAMLLASKMIMLDDRRVMVYARDHFTPTRISYDRDPMCVYNAMEEIERVLIERNLFEDLYQYYYFKLPFYFIRALSTTKREEDAEAFYLFLQKEGIDRLLKLDGVYYHKLSKNVYDLLDIFKRLNTKTKWYTKYSLSLHYYLNEYEEKICLFFDFHMRRGDYIVIWGAGIRGTMLLHFLRNHDIKNIAVVDADEKKQGREICDYLVQKPEGIMKDAGVIIVSSDSIYEDVVKKMQDKNVEILCIESIEGKRNE